MGKGRVGVLPPDSGPDHLTRVADPPPPPPPPPQMITPRILKAGDALINEPIRPQAQL